MVERGVKHSHPNPLHYDLVSFPFKSGIDDFYNNTSVLLSRYILIHVINVVFVDKAVIKFTRQGITNLHQH